ncbi:AAA family ATPase [Hyphococcus sp.]|uniref:AAA family ATPase n=1 Tax=Hyphococcus sp. TaxID=2038636 RepID=UPI003CCC32BD
MPGWTISENLNDLAIDWLLDGWVERGELTLIVGGEGVGKTRLLNALAGYGAVPEARFEGLQKSKPIKTLFFAPEGEASIKRHRLALIHHYGPDAREHIRQNIHYVNLQKLPEPFELHNASGKSIIQDCLHRLSYEHEVEIDLIVLDSISMTTSGEQLNPAIVYPALDNLKTICAEQNIGGIVAHHKNRAGSMEGSSMYRRPPTIIREIDGTALSKVYTIKETKCRDGVPNWRKEYKIEPVKIAGKYVSGVATITAFKSTKEKAKQAPVKVTGKAPDKRSNGFRVHNYALENGYEKLKLDDLERVAKMAGAVTDGKSLNSGQIKRIVDSLVSANWNLEGDYLVLVGG